MEKELAGRPGRGGDAVVVIGGYHDRGAVAPKERDAGAAPEVTARDGEVLVVVGAVNRTVFNRHHWSCRQQPDEQGGHSAPAAKGSNPAHDLAA